jgi:hypothetical protein
VFTPPETWNGVELRGRGEGFDIVFDLTGETSAEKPEIVSQPDNRLVLADDPDPDPEYLHPSPFPRSIRP